MIKMNVRIAVELEETCKIKHCAQCVLQRNKKVEGIATDMGGAKFMLPTVYFSQLIRWDKYTTIVHHCSNILHILQVVQYVSVEWNRRHTTNKWRAYEVFPSDEINLVEKLSHLQKQSKLLGTLT